jgi:hypothetical protein
MAKDAWMSFRISPDDEPIDAAITKRDTFWV